MERQVNLMAETIVLCPKGRNARGFLQEMGYRFFYCGGKGSCGKCKGKVLAGDAGAYSEEETKLLTEKERQDGVRLLCQIHAMTDLKLAVYMDISKEKPEIQRLDKMEGGERKEDDNRTGHYGVAFDLGTTTLAAALFDWRKRKLLEISAWNPQGVFGADVISRMQYCLHGDGAVTMQRKLLEGMNLMLSELLQALREQTGEEVSVDTVVAAGNSAMTHFLLGEDVAGLAKTPFCPAFLKGQERNAAALGLCVPEHTNLFTLPLLGGQVGGDITAALLSVDIFSQEEGTLLVDIGTNGEIAFFRNGKLYVCSAAAGPALEGAGISCGMRAQAGAVEKVWLTGGEVYTKVLGNAKPSGICGSGLIDAAAVLLELGKLHSDGYLEGGAFALCSGSIRIIQEDIRQFQMVKAAIRAGITAVVRAAGADVSEISQIYIAGAFGSSLRKQNAVRTGLLPEVPSGKIYAVGNASLKGAGLVLCSKERRQQAEDIRNAVVLTELAGSEDFRREYLCQMNFMQ